MTGLLGSSFDLCTWFYSEGEIIDGARAPPTLPELAPMLNRMLVCS